MISAGHVHPTDDGYFAFAATGKLDCPEAFHNRWRLTPLFEPSHPNHTGRRVVEEFAILHE